MAQMSANAVLMKFFKLPPALRMMLAIAGFGSLASIFYMLVPGLRTKEGRIWALIILLGVAVLIGIVWLIRRYVFGKKGSKLSGALESQGPTRGDIAEQERIYREKFRAKLADLKTNGLSVYQMPWFMLIGEPGCGKTASLIHSGLDFPLGKDEVPGFGGTRNYNWWFTNEAVLLDTAGRIAFHEEGTTDSTEWEYFCKLLKQFRPRCPINGVVIAIPADKLLRDSAEERTNKATILRERLRQIQQVLQVRFPTFVLVTKMDLVGGFREFFEELRVDLHLRNQMFGWSRPGEFQEPYDTSTFPAAFRGMYGRLRDWGMRYLHQRQSTDEEKGMVVTFPEAFRDLGKPLEDYIGTIFQKSPLVEPPFFRGFYFSSATQEGAPILDVFSKSKAGIQLEASVPKAVEGKSFFIHDFYGGKVFPEQGLVFRSAKHVSLNKRMRRFVWFGSAALVALLIALFFIGNSGVSKLLDQPKEDCENAGEKIATISKAAEEGKPTEVKEKSLEDNLKLAAELREHYDNYNDGWARFSARMLFIGANLSTPQGYVGEVHSRFVLESLFRPILDETGRRLRENDLAPFGQDDRAKYVDALQVYARWYGALVGDCELPPINSAQADSLGSDFEKLVDFVDVAEDNREPLIEQFEYAMKALAGDRTFARQILGETLHFDRNAATESIVAAIGKIRSSWEVRARIEGSTDERVEYWREFAARVRALADEYDRLLQVTNNADSDTGFGAAADEVVRLTTGVELIGVTDYEQRLPDYGLARKFADLETFLINDKRLPHDGRRIERLRDLKGSFAEGWNRELDPIEQALNACVSGTGRAETPQARIYAALEQSRSGLVATFEQSLRKLVASLKIEGDKDPLDYYIELGLVRLDPLDDQLDAEGREQQIKIAQNAWGDPDRERRGAVQRYLMEVQGVALDVQNESGDLNDLREWPSLLENLAATEQRQGPIAIWREKVTSDRTMANSPVTIRNTSGFAKQEFWRPLDLYAFTGQFLESYGSEQLQQRLKEMAAVAQNTTTKPYLKGLAQLMPAYGDAVPQALPYDRHRFNRDIVKAPMPATPPSAPAAPVEPPPVQPPPSSDQPANPFATPAANANDAQPTPTTPTPPPSGNAANPFGAGGDAAASTGETPLLVRYHTRDFLRNTIIAYANARVAIKSIQQGGAAPQAAASALDAGLEAYLKEYATDWADLYGDYRQILDEDTLSFVERCGRSGLSWDEFRKALVDDREINGDVLARRLRVVYEEAGLWEQAFRNNDAFNRAWQVEALSALVAEFNRLSGQPDAVSARLRPLTEGGVAPQDLYNAVSRAWRQCVASIDSGQPDSRSALLEPLTQLGVSNPAALPVVAPLIDIADYGDRLLAYDIEQKLSGIMGKYRGYPLSGGGGNMSMNDMKNLLVDLAEFKEADWALLKRVRPDAPVDEIRRQAGEWAQFIFGTPQASRQAQPRSVRLRVLLCEPPPGPQNLDSAGSVYNNITMRLPLAGDGREVVTREYSAREFTLTIADRDMGQALSERGIECILDLAADSFGAGARVELSDKNPNALAAYPDPASASLPIGGSPLALLQKVSGGRGDSSRIKRFPTNIQLAGKTIGLELIVQTVDAGQGLPAPIPRFTASTSRPVFENANVYLTSRR